MAVNGQELASLDFGNLIGGPLNAIVEAQAKSAITTANFVKEVGFTDKGEVINTSFVYNKKDEGGQDQEFKLTVPFLTMLPVPYITVENATIEFNAKITSTTENFMESNFSNETTGSVSGGWWFARAKVNSKTSYQRKSSTSDKEERTFDMKVRVQVKNQDMPAGTEKLLTMLEGIIEEQNLGAVYKVAVTAIDDQDKKKVTVNKVAIPDPTAVGLYANDIKLSASAPIQNDDDHLQLTFDAEISNLKVNDIIVLKTHK